jgi:hypothetical protein
MVELLPSLKNQYIVQKAQHFQSGAFLVSLCGMIWVLEVHHGDIFLVFAIYF